MEPFKKINFSSENYAGVHPKMMEALMAANSGNAASYGNDEITKGTVALFRQIFGENVEAYFTFNGTGANNFGLSCMLERYNSIFCSDVAHLYVDESTAPESFLGCRIYPVKSHNGKIMAGDLRIAVKRIGDVHHPQPGVVSLTQPTEYGTVYTIEELKEIKAICKANNMLLHVDGARFYNAAAYLGASLKQISADAGVDVLTLGGTKIGLMMGEAVLFFNPANAASLKFNLKRSMQLASKNRFIAIQFQALLKDNLWQQMARHTNKLAKLFEQEIAGIPSVKIAYPVETNAAFLNISPQLHDKMQDFASFYYWNDERSEARLIFSFDNTEDDVKRFAAKLRELA